ncbi:lymphocyte antigen 75 isoform X3 [Podarcis raffonei]|uniref:lymphocyte antigen 75 isoform X3 n=1 Tax=Podarcis raffonei TaxID=65483 RepID=UPI00232944E5|nr:lymphocyte antigen 75 isoform X3 [Podarcis raffonei]
MRRGARRHFLPTTCREAGLQLLLPPLLLATLLCCGARCSPDNNVFTIRHEKTNKCIQVKNQQITTGDCQGAEETLWTWVSQHRLFNLGSQKCLGLETAKSQNPLKVVDCDSDLSLWWRCDDASISSASENKLTLQNGIVTASINSSDTWRRSNSSDTICKLPYRKVYTKDGNSYGKPCEFPFLFNGTWHHDCTHNEMFTDGEWCSTTYSFDQDKEWGVCLKPEDGCQNAWEHDADSGNCYQLNTQAALTWKEAYVSCQSQGGDLLSIASASELSRIQAKEGIAERFWIGLNQLDISGGWQWSDHTPLNFVSWSQEIQNSSPLDGSGCVAMEVNEGAWMSYPCENKLPYVCKKPFNNTQSEFAAVEQYVETQCEPNWHSHNGFCYMLMSGTASWDDAHQLCNASNSNLISIHSIADVEIVVTKLHNDTADRVWIGFINEDVPALFKWSDGSKVVFTYWDQDEPKLLSNNTPNCVAYSGKLGRWNVLPCDNKLKYVCMKNGKILNDSKADKNCTGEEWRHGDFCYKVQKSEELFGKLCNLTITNRFEQEFINNLIRKHSRVEEKYFWTGLHDIGSSGEYGWGTVDGKNEMLTYTNWGHFQPALRGGCVAMSAGKYLGKWEVKNCKTTKAYSICKKYIGPKVEPEVVPKVTDPCPPGWHSGSGLACYKLFHKERVLRTRTWEEAERFCEALGGHLPSFSHLTEIKELHDILRETISDSRWVWIGLNKRNPDSLGSWQWSDNKPVSTVVMHPEFKDEYDTRDCAAVKFLRLTRRTMWTLYYSEDRQEDFYLKPFYCGSQLEWVCQIAKGRTPKTPEWYKPDGDGLQGPVLNIDGSEFWFVPNKHLSFQEAALYCSNNGSDLASVASFTALTGILNRIANLSDERQSWWLKYTAPASRYHSLFSVFSHYHERYYRNCWHISYQSWYRDSTISCSTKLPFICEKYNASRLEKHDPGYKPTRRKCRENWLVFMDKCYRMVPPKDFKFLEADEHCKSLGGSLPSITSQTEQDFITSLLPGMPPNIWIGLHFEIRTRENRWTDGSELVYSNFHPLLHGRLRKIEHDFFDDEVNNQCGVLLNNPKSPYAGTWNFTSCASIQTLAICQMKSDEAENQTQQVLNVTVNYLNVTYTIILKNLTWHDAQQECLQNNMQLVSITGQYHQAFLAMQAARYNYPLWIGLSSEDDGIHYHWADKKHISFSQWSKEDEDLLDECVYLDRDGLWKTSDCYTQKPGAICYLPANETDKPEVFDFIKCPHKIKNTPWMPFRNSCYSFMIAKDRWKGLKSDEAHHLCRMMNMNASLLTIRDEDENSFVVEQLHSFSGLARWLWLGLIYDADDGNLKWDDNTYLSYNNWRLGRPYVKNNNFVAGIGLDGVWDMYNYSGNWLPLQFSLHSILVCKIEMGPKEYKPPLPEKLPHGNKTYWILQKQLSWYDAWRECKRNGSDLASVHSESQQVFLENIVKRDGYPLWIGLSNHNESDSDFEWSDGSTFDYKPWEYEHSHSPGNCFLLDTKGFWNRLDCSRGADGAICYYPSNKVQSKQAENPTYCPKTTGSASQWIQYKQHCYAFDLAFYNFSIYNWKEAKEVCKKLDPSATLLTIENEEENKFVSAHLREHYFVTGRVWLGMQENAESMKWLDGSEIKYVNWEKGKEKANGKCSVVFSTNGTWSKTDCRNLQSRVVCKAPQVACPSAAWLSFGRSCYALLEGTLETLDDTREVCKGNASGADIISINNKEENSFIRSTFCTHWHGPEYISLGMFFDTDVPYEKKYLPDETAWTTTLVITSTVIVAVSAAFLWYLYQRRVSSGTGCTAYSSTTQVPSSDEVVLVEEENEYTA